MGMYAPAFVIAFLLVGLAVFLAFLPELRDFLHRHRRSRDERHVIRRGHVDADDPPPAPRTDGEKTEGS